MMQAGDHPLRADLAQLPDRVRLPLDFAVDAAAAEIARLDEADWTRHFVPDNFSGEWSALPLRAPRGASHPILRIAANPGGEWDDTEYLDAMPALRGLLAAIACPLEAARLMRLGPGSTIHEHRDLDLDAAHGVARLHIPILTAPEVDFRLSGARIVMNAGECWYLRLSDPHRVANGSPRPRIHLVIDAQVNDWLADRLLAGVEAASG